MVDPVRVSTLTPGNSGRAKRLGCTCSNRKRATCGLAYATLGIIVLFVLLATKFWQFFITWNSCMIINQLDIASESKDNIADIITYFSNCLKVQWYLNSD